jgi:hypothetical protein
MVRKWWPREFAEEDIQDVPMGRSIFWEVIVSVILSRKVYIYMCPIPNGFRD